MKKILSLLIAVLMIVGMLASCGGSDEPALDGTDKADVNQPAGDDGATDAKETKVYKVNLHIRASADAADKYVAEDYEFEADPAITSDNYAYDSVLAIVDAYMFDNDLEIVFDENGNLVKIGELEADITQLWLVKKASAPMGAGDAEPIDGNIDSYNKIANGDTFVIYLS